MESMNCKSFRMEMEEGRGNARLSDDARRHREACAGCRRFENDSVSVRRLIASLDRVAAPADFDFRVRARLAAASSARSNSNFFSVNKFIPGASGIALAVAFALVAALAIFLRHNPSPQFTVAHSQPTAEQQSAPPENSSLPAQSSRPASVETPLAVTNGESLEAKVRNARRIESASGTNGWHATVQRARALKFERNEESAISVANSGVSSNSADSSVTAASVVVINPASPAAGQILQLQTATQPVKLTLENERGAKRKVSLNPVTFGAQELIKQNDASPLPATRGVW